MALVETEHFYEFLARLRNDPDNDAQGQVVGMHLTKRRVIVDDQTSAVRSSVLLSPMSMTWSELMPFIGDTDYAALKAAVLADPRA